MAQSARHSKTKAIVALLLTFAAGCVDIIGYLTIYTLFTAHMTGNTVHLANNILEGDWRDATAAACIIAAFLIGSVFGRSIIEVGVRTRVRSIASAALVVEALLIAAVVMIDRSLLAGPMMLVSLVLLAGAMGMQTATLTRIGSLTVHTTFVTGMLNKLAQLISQAMFLSYDISRGRDVFPQRAKVLRQTRFIFSIWLLYLFGAATGTWMRSVWGIRSLLVPVCLVAAMIAVDQVTPLSIEEEQEEP